MGWFKWKDKGKKYVGREYKHHDNGLEMGIQDNGKPYWKIEDRYDYWLWYEHGVFKK